MEKRPLEPVDGPARGSRPRKKRVTVDDVARLAGTSTAVVSYVMNNGPRPVAPETRARVEAAISQLSYRPNAVARALRRSETGLIGLVVPDNSNPFFAELARVIEEELFSRGYMLLLGNSVQSHAREAAYVKALLESQVDGLLLISASEETIESEALLTLAATDVPLVMLDRRVPGVEGTSLFVANENGGYEATLHLMEHGHERIACVSGPNSLTTAIERTAGYRRAMDEARFPIPESLLTFSAFDREGGYRSALKLLRSEDRPSAIFATSDQQAIGVIRAAHQLGFFIPYDLAVIGFDGIPESEYTAPPLTTIRQPTDEMARRAVEALISRIEGGPRTSSSEVLPVELIKRASCGCPFDTNGHS
jgi:LacI family transcriptional regulator